MNETVFVALYNPMIYESAFGIISIHKTLKGAEMAMEFHKAEQRMIFDEQIKWEKENTPEDVFNCSTHDFPQFKAWITEEVKLNQ